MQERENRSAGLLCSTTQPKDIFLTKNIIINCLLFEKIKQQKNKEVKDNSNHLSESGGGGGTIRRAIEK